MKSRDNVFDVVAIWKCSHHILYAYMTDAITNVTVDKCQPNPDIKLSYTNAYDTIYLSKCVER